MIEEWKDINGYNGIYQVSNLGNVRNAKRDKILLQDTTKGGYKRVTLYKDGKSKHFQVHRLVAFSFLPNPVNFPCVNHKDENPSNNNVDNLEWCTYSYNINYGTRNTQLSQNAKKVCQMDFYGNVLATYISIGFAAKMLGVDPSNIYKCCNGELSYAYDYKWKFI